MSVAHRVGDRALLIPSCPTYRQDHESFSSSSHRDFGSHGRMHRRVRTHLEPSATYSSDSLLSLPAPRRSWPPCRQTASVGSYFLVPKCSSYWRQSGRQGPLTYSPSFFASLGFYYLIVSSLTASRWF